MKRWVPVLLVLSVALAPQAWGYAPSSPESGIAPVMEQSIYREHTFQTGERTAPLGLSQVTSLFVGAEIVGAARAQAQALGAAGLNATWQGFPRLKARVAVAGAEAETGTGTGASLKPTAVTRPEPCLPTAPKTQLSLPAPKQPVALLPEVAESLAARGATHWNPLNGPGPLGEKLAATFRGASYTELVTSEPTTLYRVYGGKADELGPYWTRTPPAGPLQSQIDSALLPQWGNTAQNVTRIQVPPGTTIYEGVAAAQGGLVGGGNQVFIPHVDAKWIIK